MSLKKSAGNMYPWVTHTHSHLAGECPHRCPYCYVQAMGERFQNVREKYSGPLRLIESEFAVQYGSGRTIFIEHMNDLFAAAVPAEFVERILAHCRQWPQNTYVFQSKNPARFLEFGDQIPSNSIVGTTIETNHVIPALADAPPPSSRYLAMIGLPWRTFVTIEPILAFDLAPLTEWVATIRPEFLNIGADSKRRGLSEPSQAEVLSLVAALKTRGVEVREKHNLARLVAN